MKNFWMGFVLLVIGVAIGWFGNRCYKKVCLNKQLSSFSQQDRQPARSGEFVNLYAPNDSDLNKSCDINKPLYIWDSFIICIAK